MADLEIPAAALHALDAAVLGSEDDDADMVVDARAIAGPVVAAELRRIAAMFESNATEAHSPVLADAQYLRQRADELDGGA